MVVGLDGFPKKQKRLYKLLAELEALVSEG
jgi:hypothetical protein